MTYSIVNLSDVQKANRFDAEYFKPEYLDKDEILSNIKAVNLIDISESIINFGAYSLCSDVEYKKQGVPFLQVGNIKESIISGKFKYIDESLSKKLLYKSLVKEKQVLITIAGTIGNAVVAQDLPKNTNSNQAIANITLKDYISPFYVATFLNSQYGKYQSQRLIVSNVQPNLLLVQVKSIKIPLLSQAFQGEIERMVKQAYEAQSQSRQLYKDAETLLLEELGLLDYQIQHHLTFQTTKKEIDQAKRCDAEYFQPKYAEIIEKIEGYKGGFDYLENLTTYINNGNQPPYVTNGEIKFFSQKWIKDKTIDYSFLESNEEPMVSKEFFKEEKNNLSLVNKGDILYYSVGANLGYCHNYLEDEPISVGSFINIIRSDKTKINELFLGFIINSIIGRLQGDREKSGIAQPYIYAKNLRRFKIPLISPPIQEQIAHTIEQSHRLRKQSLSLLKTATQAVELAIEHGEEHPSAKRGNHTQAEPKNTNVE